MKKLIATILVFLLFSGLYTYSEYSKYPKSQRYPVRLMTVTVDYESYWDYLWGEQRIIINTYRGKLDATVQHQGWLDPIYNAPDL